MESSRTSRQTRSSICCPEIYAYTRTLEDEMLLVILNFFAGSPVFELPADIAFTSHELLISNYDVDAGEDIRKIRLRPYEARVYRLRKERAQ